MPTTVIAATSTPGQYSTTGQALTKTAADTTNNNHIVATSNVLLIAYNAGVGAATITITSEPDPTFGRSGDVSAQSLAADEIRVFRLTTTGWADSSGNIVITCSSTDIKLDWMDLNA